MRFRQLLANFMASKEGESELAITRASQPKENVESENIKEYWHFFFKETITNCLFLLERLIIAYSYYLTFLGNRNYI